MIRLFIILLSFLLVFPVISYSQGETSLYPVFFDQYLSGLSIINPSTSGIEDNSEYNIGNQRLLGNFSRLSTNFFIFNKRLKTLKKTYYPFSSAGLMVYNDREGQYLNRGRMYLQYAWHARLSNKVFFSGGLKLGGVNYLVKGTPLSGNGSDYNIDGGVGVSFYTANYYFGLCVDQLFRSELQPIDEITVLNPFLIIHSYKKIKLNEQVSLIPSFIYRYIIEQEDRYENIISGNLKCEIKNKISFSAGFRNKYGILFSTEILNISIKNGNISFGLSYITPLSQSLLNISLLEFNAKYFLKSTK